MNATLKTPIDGMRTTPTAETANPLAVRIGDAVGGWIDA
jgi:hypothetical protein